MLPQGGTRAGTHGGCSSSSGEGSNLKAPANKGLRVPTGLKMTRRSIKTVENYRLCGLSSTPTAVPAPWQWECAGTTFGICLSMSSDKFHLH